MDTRPLWQLKVHHSKCEWQYDWIGCSVRKAVYKVVHDDSEPTYGVDKTVTWTKLYHQMGHISCGVAKTLAEKGLVTGTKLIYHQDILHHAKAVYIPRLHGSLWQRRMRESK